MAEYDREQAELRQQEEEKAPPAVKPGECQFCGLHVGRGIGFHRMRCEENPDAT